VITPNGNIKDMTIPWLLQDLWMEQVTGTVVFSRDEVVKKVFFKEGEVFSASSNRTDDRLGEYLLRTGRLTRDQFALASELVIKTGNLLGGVLFDMGAFSAKELVSAVKLQVAEIVLDLFSWRDGTYQLENGSMPPKDLMPLQISIAELIVKGVRDLDWKIVRKSLPPLKAVLKPATNAPLLINGIDMERDHQTVLSLVDGNKSIEELCVLSEIGDFSTLKALYVLIALRLIEVGGTRTAEEIRLSVQNMAAEEKKSAKAGATQEPEAAEIRVTREMIQDAFKSIAIQDYYQILGVGRGATPQELRKAYLTLAKVYHPDRHIDSELADMKEQLETLFMKITEANDILSVPGKRDKYNLDLASGIKKYGKEKRRATEEENKKSTASAQFDEGQKQYKIQNYWGAEEAFRWAARLDPGNADYIFHQGLALARIPRRGHEAQEYFEKAVQLAPSHVEYSLELGNFYIKHGLKAKALLTFQEALVNNPTSEKIKEALANVGKQS
jgi:curved DNA-binding protein CbpA